MKIRICDVCKMEIPRYPAGAVYKLKLPKAYVEELHYAGDGLTTRYSTRLELCDSCWDKILGAVLTGETE